jgi:hypothetical protein
LVDRFLACSSAALHFWTNAKTIDIWEEGGDGEVEVRSEELLPENAPDRLDSLYPGGSLWPRSSPERKQALNQLGPKYLKRPLVCIKLCTRDVASPEKSDVLAIIRMPTNQPLSVIADATLAIDQVQQVGPVPWKLYQRRRGVTRTIPAKKCVVA